ncbi:MAG TPA: hypothetical protein VFL13_01200 [Candidatus Baltobacteraceae bacterium]|nr:hypothetical protein [Candidatus Baltobacteraceae bacterium]
MTSYRTVLFSAVVFVAAAVPVAPAVADSVPAVFKATTVRTEPIRPADSVPAVFKHVVVQAPGDPGAGTPAAAQSWLQLFTSFMFGFVPFG